MPEPLHESPALKHFVKLLGEYILLHGGEFATPEHLLYVLCSYSPLRDSFEEFGGDIEAAEQRLLDYIEPLNSDIENEQESDYLAVSEQFKEMMNIAVRQAAFSESTVIDVTHVVNAMFELKESLAAAILKGVANGDQGSFIQSLILNSRNEDFMSSNEIEDTYDVSDSNSSPDDWRSLVVCLNDNLENKNPLIGREEELERTIRVLCRRDKNNPLHVGEPGTGKTALVYGLADRINRGEVPEKLRDSRIYLLDLGSMIAGTQYRGEFEKRLKKVMDGARKEGNVIIYIDEIHNLVGAGAIGNNSLDASNILKPYLESGEIRFIGSTTYEEYNRHFSQSKGMVRRFQQIDIAEPSVEDTIEILTRLKPAYEKYHGVEYSAEAIETAVKGTVRHLPEKFLPDKAIDLIDEAGAYRQIHPSSDSRQMIDKDLVTMLLSKMARIETAAVQTSSSEEMLESLESRILQNVFGQDDAVRAVTEAILLSKAGLTEENKPLASLLFVGPTGVGKTEVAKVLSEELGVPLIRLDMSEYAEKHAVAKLIGSPAGYVGYEDGGILTDAIRKSPNSVLLLDEIEKAHPDIYNILLQVMDYARLTDNKGRHTDFRNVILIMTSNAGAQFAARAKVGFGNNVTSGQAMLREVKRTFKPEFINRLSSTVVFNEMNREMASLILDKKLRQLQNQVKERKVEIEVTPEAREFILTKGFTPEYGARELDRVISSELKPILMKAILFGNLKNGGKAIINTKDNTLSIL